MKSKMSILIVVLLMASSVFARTTAEQEEYLRGQLITNDAHILKMNRNYSSYGYGILYPYYLLDNELDYRVRIRVEGDTFRCRTSLHLNSGFHQILGCDDLNGDVDFDKYVKKSVRWVYF